MGANVALFDLCARWGHEDIAEAIADRCRRYLKLTGYDSDAEGVACASTIAAVLQMGPGRWRFAARGWPCTDANTYGARALLTGCLEESEARFALLNFYNITVRISNVAARLAALVLWLRNKLGSSISPEFIGRLNICNADNHKAAE
jgi:hypothetical protein